MIRVMRLRHQTFFSPFERQKLMGREPQSQICYRAA